MSTQVNLYKAKTKLSGLVERAANGEDIVIAKSGRPRVRLVPIVERSEPRTPGRWAGRVVLDEEWDRDLTDHFEGL